MSEITTDKLACCQTDRQTDKQTRQLEENDSRGVIWDTLSPMSIPRFGHGMVECMGWAYVVGK